MKSFSQISTLKELEEARRSLKGKVQDKQLDILLNYEEIKETLSPLSLIGTGVRYASNPRRLAIHAARQLVQIGIRHLRRKLL